MLELGRTCVSRVKNNIGYYFRIFRISTYLIIREIVQIRNL